MISVVICTHNPRRDYLERSLQSLDRQTLAKNQWEFLLVDNASTTAVDDSSLVSWHPQGRIVREEKVGLTQARLCGISNTKEELLVFVDDDNVLAPDYLANALQISQTFPFLGIFGAGRIEPEFETPPADWSERYLPMLALRHREIDTWGNNLEDNPHMPYGAGICLRRKVAETFAQAVKTDPRRLRLGRSGQNLASCEDYDIASTAVSMGLGFGIFARLYLTHLISGHRIAEDYLLRLRSAMAESHAFLFYLWHGRKPEEPFFYTGLRHRVRILLNGKSVHDRFQAASLAGHRRAVALIDELEAQGQR